MVDKEESNNFFLASFHSNETHTERLSGSKNCVLGCSDNTSSCLSVCPVAWGHSWWILSALPPAETTGDFAVLLFSPRKGNAHYFLTRKEMLCSHLLKQISSNVMCHGICIHDQKQLGLRFSILLMKLQLLQHVTLKTKMTNAVKSSKEKGAAQPLTLWDPRKSHMDMTWPEQGNDKLLTHLAHQ